MSKSEEESKIIGIRWIAHPGFSIPEIKKLAEVPPLPSEVAAGHNIQEVKLLSLPYHLQNAWWTVADEMSQQPPNKSNQPSSYSQFAIEVIDFLRFKNVEVGFSPRCDVLLNSPGRNRSIYKPSFQAETHIIVNLGNEAVTLMLWHDDDDNLLDQHCDHLKLESRKGCVIPENLGYGTTTLGNKEPEILLRIVRYPS